MYRLSSRSSLKQGLAIRRSADSSHAAQVRVLEGEIRGVKEKCDQLLSAQRHLQSKLHALEEELGRIHSKVCLSDTCARIMQIASP